MKDRIEAFQCAHETGQCPLCRDKDLKIAQLQQQIEQLKKRSLVDLQSVERKVKVETIETTSQSPPPRELDSPANNFQKLGCRRLP